jgi:hypothetical protein
VLGLYYTLNHTFCYKKPSVHSIFSFIFKQSYLTLEASGMCHCCKRVHSIQHFSHNMTQHHMLENCNLQNYSSGRGGGGQKYTHPWDVVRINSLCVFSLPVITITMRQFSKTLQFKLLQFHSPAFIDVLCKDFPAYTVKAYTGA